MKYLVVTLLLSGCSFSEFDKRDANIEQQKIQLQLDCKGDCRLEVNRDQANKADRGSEKTDAELSAP
jgi:hypothetical protein